MENVAELQITLTAKQATTLHYLRDGTTREVLFGGGAGGAKSFLGCYWLHTNACRYPGTRWLMGRAQLKILKETTLNTFFDVAKMLPIISWKIDGQSGTIKYENGSQIIMKDLFAYPSDPNFDSLGSLEITGAFIDEANECTIKAKNIVRSRIRYRLREYDLSPKALFTCNPAKNWVYSQFYIPWRENRLEESRKFVQSLLEDNPYIDPFYRENLLTLDTASKERLLHGNWEYDDDPSTLIEYNKILDFFTNEHIESSRERYMSADIALHGSDKFVVAIWEGWKVIDFKIYNKMDGKEVLSIIKQLALRYKVPASNVVYDADGLGSYLKGWLNSAYGFKNGGRPKGETKKKREEFANLKSQCYFHFAKKLQLNEAWFAAELSEDNLETLKQELGVVRNQSFGTDKKLTVLQKDKVREIIGRSPDFSDALMMRTVFDLLRKKQGGIKIAN